MKESVSALPNGIDHEVKPGGANFFGDQRQCLVVARALYRVAEPYVFDDSFLALNYAVDVKLCLDLNIYTNGIAILIAGRRIASIRHANEIFALEDGRITGRGIHAELFSSCGTYKEIVAPQMKEEEVA